MVFGYLEFRPGKLRGEDAESKCMHGLHLYGVLKKDPEKLS